MDKDERRELLKLVITFIVFVFFFCVFAYRAEAQGYWLTQEQLEALTTTAENLRTDNTRQQLQLEDLQSRLDQSIEDSKQLEENSKLLQQQLKTEREASQNLRISYDSYVNSVSTILHDQEAEIQKQKQQKKIWIIIAITEAAIAIVLIGLRLLLSKLDKWRIF